MAPAVKGAERGVGRRFFGVALFFMVLTVFLTACAPPSASSDRLEVVKPFGAGGVLLDLNSLVPGTTFLVFRNGQSEQQSVVVGVGRRVLVEVPDSVISEGDQGLGVIARAPCYRQSIAYISDPRQKSWGKTFSFTQHDRLSNRPECGGRSDPASDRVALVIGNQDYWQNAKDEVEGRSVGIGPLKQAVPDAEMVAEALKQAHFSLVGGGVITDVRKEHFGEAIRIFSDMSKNAKIAFFYYAGHGVSLGDKNWIVPVDFRYYNQNTYRTDLIDPDEIIGAMGSSPGLIRVVVLDACRGPPVPGFKDILRREKSQMPSNTILAYSTQPGAPAADGGYAQYLVQALRTPHLGVMEIFQKITVLARQKNPRQLPVYYSTMSIGADYKIQP